ncbi:MAG: T9SS type A sorting domain-containing protein [Bacteroidota bacterium]
MKNFIKLIVLILLPYSSMAQMIKFEKVYGGNAEDHGYSVAQAYDKGFCIAGITTSFGNGIMDAYILRTDSLGIPLWHRTFGGSNIDKAYSIEATTDSGFVIAGYTNSFGLGGYDMYVIKINKLGDTVWTKNYGGTDWDFAYSVKQTTDGGYIIAGGTYGMGAGAEDMYLVKTNANGDTLWTKAYGGIHGDEAKSVKQTSDGGYILTGVTKSFGDIDGDVYTVKTDMNGDTLWTYKYSDTLEDVSYDVLENTIGEYIISCNTKTTANGVERMIIKLSSSGAFINKIIYSGINDDGINSITQSADGRFAFTGYTYSFGFGSGTSDCFIVMGDPFGTLAGFAIGGNKNETGNSIRSTSDGGYVICGRSNSYSSMDHIFLIKTDSNGVAPSTPGVIVTDINSIERSKNEFKVFPNPSVSSIFITNNSNSSHNGAFTLTLTDNLGRKMYTQSYHENKFSEPVEINTENLSNGIYFVSISTEFYTQTQKVIVQHN